MCIFNFVIFVILCSQEVLSGVPELRGFAAGKPKTWEQADIEISNGYTGKTIEAYISKTSRRKKAIASGREDKAWWYATSTSPEHNKAEWNHVITGFRLYFEGEMEKPGTVPSAHVFIGIKLMINTFAYHTAKKTYEEAHAGATYPPPGTLPAGITLLWSNGQAPTKTIALDDRSYQAGLLNRVLNSANTHDEVRKFMTNQMEYEEKIAGIMKRFQDLLYVGHSKAAEDRMKCRGISDKDTATKLEKELDERFAAWKTDRKAIGLKQIHELKAPSPALGLVMFIEKGSTAAGSPPWVVGLKFIPINEPFSSEGFSGFLIQDLEKTKVKPPKVPAGGIKAQRSATGERVEEVKASKGEMSPFMERGRRPRLERKGTGFGIPESESSAAAGRTEEFHSEICSVGASGTAPRRSAKKKRSRSSKEYAEPISVEEEKAKRAKEEKVKRAEVERIEEEWKRTKDRAAHHEWMAVEEPSPERYPLHYAHNDGYGYVNNTKESKSPTMIILMITMCIMTVVCCGCAIIAAECYCIGKAHGSKNKETMEEEDAILRLEHIQNCI